MRPLVPPHVPSQASSPARSPVGAAQVATARSRAQKAASHAIASAKTSPFRSPIAVEVPTSPHLIWPGRSWSLGDHATGGNASGNTTVVESSRAGTSAISHRLILGDVLDVSAALHREKIAGSVALVYVDPPYASQADYVHEARLDGRADGRLKRSLAYEDNWSPGAYLDMLAPRLEALVSLLAPHGSIWVQVDWRASHFVRLLLDEIMGASRFLNEIVWRRAPNLGRQAASSQFGRTLDTIIVYGGKKARLTPPTRLEPIDERAIRWDEEKRPTTLAPRGDYTDASIARLEAEGRVHRTASGKVYIKYFLVKDNAGRWCRERRVDALWTDVPPLRHAKLEERTGYPTQKPRALLDRIVAAASQPGDLVVDLFSGSGTTAESAHALGRRAIVGDVAPIAIANARARLLRANAPLSVESCEGRSLAGHAAVSATVTRTTVKQLEIKLGMPVEPLAWCAGSIADGVLELTAHSERALGTSARAIDQTITVAIPQSVPVGVRVYEDDGAIASLEMAASDLPVVGGAITVRASASSRAPFATAKPKAKS